MRKPSLYFLALLWYLIQMEKVFLFLFACSVLTLWTTYQLFPQICPKYLAVTTIKLQNARVDIERKIWILKGSFWKDILNYKTPFNVLFNFQITLLSQLTSTNNFLLMLSIWVESNKGFVYSFFQYTCTFIIMFLGLFRNNMYIIKEFYTSISYHTYSDGLKLIVFKIDKIASKNLNDEKHR